MVVASLLVHSLLLSEYASEAKPVHEAGKYTDARHCTVYVKEFINIKLPGEKKKKFVTTFMYGGLDLGRTDGNIGVEPVVNLDDWWTFPVYVPKGHDGERLDEPGGLQFTLLSSSPKKGAKESVAGTFTLQLTDEDVENDKLVYQLPEDRGEKYGLLNVQLGCGKEAVVQCLGLDDTHLKMEVNDPDYTIALRRMVVGFVLFADPHQFVEIVARRKIDNQRCWIQMGASGGADKTHKSQLKLYFPDKYPADKTFTLNHRFHEYGSDNPIETQPSTLHSSYLDPASDFMEEFDNTDFVRSNYEVTDGHREAQLVPHFTGNPMGPAKSFTENQVESLKYMFSQATWKVWTKTNAPIFLYQPPQGTFHLYNLRGFTWVDNVRRTEAEQASQQDTRCHNCMSWSRNFYKDTITYSAQGTEDLPEEPNATAESNFKDAASSSIGHAVGNELPGAMLRWVA